MFRIVGVIRKPKTKTRHLAMPCMMPLVQSDPILMSRGAIQHGIPADSSWMQIASAIELSLLEWLIKTTGDPWRIENESQQELRELSTPGMHGATWIRYRFRYPVPLE